MIKNIEVEFKPTAEELSNELWQMDCVQQVEFLFEVSCYLKLNSTRFLTRLQYIADEINREDNRYCKDIIIRMLKTTLDYIEGEVENETDG